MRLQVLKHKKDFCCFPCACGSVRNAAPETPETAEASSSSAAPLETAAASSAALETAAS